ncbi:MAG TPA: protein kinase [Kofleriaceae bacterium]|nr:protein kinase [Kofleriaceae bacterium]
MSEQRATERKTTDRLVGELLASRYLIEHKLGEGAMGAVYRARHVKVGRPFAVKVLHRKLLEDQKIALRFEREAELAGRLHHPNVVGVVDVGETPDGLRYMVMDFAEGQDLAELLAEAPMPPERIISLVRQMLEGLYHAHEAGLIHRDFKPENVIIERNDHGMEVPRIVDFGISILREGGDSNDGTGRLTTNGLVLGTPHYMAPEQAVADPIDHRIDLFAMGIVVYELLSGKLPFDGNGAEVARANLLLDPPPISQRVPYLEVDPLLEAFARRLMAKQRDHRPATAKKARELLDLIERDRAAAAAALGVPLDAEVRTPKSTEPVSPQASAGHAPHGTERAQRLAPAEDPATQAPPASAPAQPLEAPPVQHAGAAPMPPPVAAPAAVATPTDELPPPRDAAPRTAVADPLPWGDGSPRSRRRWLIAGGVGLAAAGAIVAIALGASGGDAAKPSDEQKVSMTATPEPASTPEPAPEPPAPEPVPSEPAAATATPAVADPPAVDPAPAKVDPAPEPPVARPDPGTRKRPTPTRPNPGTAKVGPGPKSPVMAPEPPKNPTESPALTKAEVNRRWIADYNQVNSELNALEGKAKIEDLRVLYGRVKYNEALKDDAKRQEMIENLAKVRAELAKRKKR